MMEGQKAVIELGGIMGHKNCLVGDEQRGLDGDIEHRDSLPAAFRFGSTWRGAANACDPNRDWRDQSIMPPRPQALGREVGSAG